MPAPPHRALCEWLGDFPNYVVGTPSLGPSATACSSYATPHARDLAAALGKEGLPWGPLGPASTITFPLSPQQLPPASCLHCPATNRQAPDCTSMSPRPCGHITFPEELPSCAWAVTSWRWAFKSRRSATTSGAGVPTLLQEQLSGSPLGWGRGPLRNPKCSFRLQIPRVCVLPLPQVTKRSG